jgi:16S rRNA (guanine527-N7)-methyltransferase
VEHERELRHVLVHSACEIGLSLSEDQIVQFMCYLSQLTHWNKTVNLTSITDPQEIVIKHFIDSLNALIVTKFPSEAVLVDVGTGGGFPGIPLKIVRNDLRLVLIEPSQKKCSFLASVVGLLKLRNARIFHGTLRQYCDNKQPVADMITIRALRFDEIRDQAVRLISQTGRVILYRTERLDLKDIGTGFELETQQSFSLPQNSGGRVITVLSKTSQT